MMATAFLGYVHSPKLSKLNNSRFNNNKFKVNSIKLTTKRYYSTAKPVNNNNN